MFLTFEDDVGKRKKKKKTKIVHIYEKKKNHWWNMVACIRVSKKLTFVKIELLMWQFQFELELLGDLNQDAPRFTTD